MEYWDSIKEPGPKESRIVIRVAPSLIEKPVTAVVDTAAPWCIFRPDIGDRIAGTLTLLHGSIALSTRLGIVRGGLYRGQILLPADEGEPMDVDATIFLSPEWQGDNFVGYEGLLQRIRFAVDPQRNLFYFGHLG